MRDNNLQSNKKNNNYENIQENSINSIDNNSQFPKKKFFTDLFTSKIIEININNSQITTFNIFKIIEKNLKNNNKKIISFNSKNNNFRHLTVVKKFAFQILNSRLFFYSREGVNDCEYINYINMFTEITSKFKNPDLPFFSALNKIQKSPKLLQITSTNLNNSNIRKTRYFFLVQKLLNVLIVRKNFFIQGNSINHNLLKNLLDSIDFDNTFGIFGFESKIKKKNLYNINFTNFNNSFLSSNILGHSENPNNISEFNSLKKTKDVSLLGKKTIRFYKIKKDPKKLGLKKKIKNEFNLYKIPGRKKKNSGETGPHNKYSKDNMMRKLKNKIIESARRLINQKIKDESKDKPKEVIKKIEGIYNQDLNIKYNFWLYLQPLKIIFQFKLSAKYSRDDGVSNETLINYIFSQDKSKYPLTKKLLNMHFHEYYHNIFLGENKNWVNEYKIIKNNYGIDYALQKIEEISENDQKYKYFMINLAKNYEIFFLKKNPRLSNSHKGGLFETDIKKFINSISNEDYKTHKNKFINVAKKYINLPDESFNQKNIYIGKYTKSEDGFDRNLAKKKDKEKKIREKEFLKIKTEVNENNKSYIQKKETKRVIFKVIKFKNKKDIEKEEKISGLDHSASSIGINESNDSEKKDIEIII